VVREDATGEVVPAENPHALGMALINALNRGHDPARAANRKHALATRFNWERTARETRDLYLSLIS
jgi:glycosyltransferase involved in cell wall biosynthesis